MNKASLGATWDETKRILRELRATGLSVTESELDRGLRGVSVPIFGASAEIIGSLSIVAPLKYHSRFGVDDSATMLRAGRRQIEAGLALLAANDRAARAAAAR